ncbi:MAG: hypothetical protein LUE65_14200 [Clostridiales bacterium]|nr:hypothetical protein [Clostridiales bacterium]
MAVKEMKLDDRLKPIMEHHIELFDRAEIPVRDQLYEEAFAWHKEEPTALRFAYGLKNFLEKKKISLQEYDILAGFAYRYSYNTTMPIDFPRDYDPRLRPARMISQKMEASMCQEYYGFPDDCTEMEDFHFFESAIRGGGIKHWESGHILPGYHNILHKGFGGLIAECDIALSKEHSDQERMFITSMKICAEASASYILRFHELALKLLKDCNNPIHRAQLHRIASACANIAYQPASNYFEAVQLLWLSHEIMYGESIPTSTSLGRVDQYLDEYYCRDEEAGLIDYEEGSIILQALWIKFSTTIHAYQNITLGGCDANGNYQATPVTYMALQATRLLRNDQPLLCLRYADNIPQDLWEESVALLKCGLGFPAFFSDANTVATRIRAGHTPEDAHNFALIGCVEPGAPGAEYSKTEVLRVNWAKVMELCLAGKNAYGSDEKLAPYRPHALSEFTDFDSFYNWYKEELLHFTYRAMRVINLMDKPWPFYYPTPWLSLTMDGCIANGMDVTGGGTRYNNSGINTAGMANAVDSLAAIRKAVFEDHRVTLQELADACACNFEGQDDLLHYLKTECPKFGNDDDRTDALMADLTAAYAKMTDRVRNPRGGKWQLGLYTVEDHAKLGTLTGALPEGRLAGVSLANAMCPVQGADHVGPTAVINSILKTDQSVATNNMVLDLKFNPAFMEKPAHIEALRSMIHSYFRRGGLEIQFNVIDRATLVDAQNHPEKHRNLVVRVSGFSAYFITLMKTTQDEIINRTEYAAI